MSYFVQIKRSAAKELARLPLDDRERLLEAIDRLRKQPLLGSLLKGDMRGLRRLRVGAFRILYEVLDEELIVLVIRVAHRRDVYR